MSSVPGTSVATMIFLGVKVSFARRLRGDVEERASVGRDVMGRDTDLMKDGPLERCDMVTLVALKLPRSVASCLERLVLSAWKLFVDQRTLCNSR